MWPKVTMLVLSVALLAGCASRGVYAPPQEAPRTTDPHRRAVAGAPAGDEGLTAALSDATAGRYDAAIARLRRLHKTYVAAGRSSEAAESLFWIGFCREKQGRAGRAAELYGEVADRWPDAAAAGHARARLGQLRSPAGP